MGGSVLGVKEVYCREQAVLSKMKDEQVERPALPLHCKSASDAL
jgi:hypothetical protein